jgi:hypothetical protein
MHATVKCSSGDVITVAVLQQSGSVQTIYGVTDYTHFSGYRLY